MASFSNIATGAFAAVSLAAGSALRKASESTYEFDKAMTKMVTQIGLSREEVDAMSKDILNMSAAYIFYFSLARRIQKRLVAILASLLNRSKGKVEPSQPRVRHK